MKKLSIFIFILLSSIGVFIFLIGRTSEENGRIVNFNDIRNKPKRDKSLDKRSGPEMERQYFEQQHYPYGTVLEPHLLKSIWDDIRNMPDENEQFYSATTWQSIGPWGGQIPSTNTKFTGRILDINATDTSNMIIASASGGLWRYANPNPLALTEQLTSQVAGSFDVQPGNSNVIILGTGEPLTRAGTGMYKTTNGGVNWTSVSLNDTTPGGFYKIRYSSANVIHAASDRGYYRSDNNGLNWVKLLSGNITDVAVHPTDNNIVYCCRRQNVDADSGGVYKSTNNGVSWVRMSLGAIPTTDVGRTSISIAKSNPAFIYVAMSRRNGYMWGVYRTSGGDSWVNISPPEDIFEGIGWYSNEISVSPVSASKLLVGGVWLWRSTNLGMTWTKLDNNLQLNIHADQHAIVWDSTGDNVWLGNDGGLAYSDDEGFSYNTPQNKFPITQYYNVDVSLSSPTVFIGGSQDNGITSTTNNGAAWRYNISWGGDGSGAAINPFNPLEMYMTIGVYNSPWAFRRHRTTNAGLNWVELNNGIDNSAQWYTRIKTDNANPVTVYTSSSGFMYYSTNTGNNWIKSNPTEFPAWIFNFSVRKYNDTSIVYAITDSRNDGERIYLKVGSAAYMERSAGISDGYAINAITMHPVNSNIAFAVIKGLYSGSKVFKTTNRGLNWSNVSSNLPNVPAAALAIYPLNDNIMYLGSEMGCYKTTNGGANWFRWNDGLPEAVIITELKPYFNGADFYILAGTYGRSMWIRNDDELVGIAGNSGEIPAKFELQQNYPNPFNPVTNIRFSVPYKLNVEINIYDVNGKLVETAVNKNMDAGFHEIKFDGSKLASGVYFYKLKAGSFTQVRKMVIIK
jgi:photosystem II stability/assembly factor-like uncharacterized protein